MKNIKLDSLLLVGGDKTLNIFFQNYFNRVISIDKVDKSEIITRLEREKFPIIFSIDNIESIREVKRLNRDIITVLILSSFISDIVMEAIKLKVFDLLELPLDIRKLSETLSSIDRELNSGKTNFIEINGLYSFDLDKEILYNEYFDEVKLTKSELKLLKLLLKSKGKYLSQETIEYNIWEEEYLNYNCDGRLKTLLNSLRKKLPPKSILNSYGVGYRII